MGNGSDRKIIEFGVKRYKWVRESGVKVCFILVPTLRRFSISKELVLELTLGGPLLPASPPCASASGLYSSLPEHQIGLLGTFKFNAQFINNDKRL